MNHVLIAPGTSTQGGDRIYHQPNPDNPDVPNCRNHRKGGGTQWARKDADNLPHHRECKDCSGESINRAHTGKELGAQIQGLWADDSEGSA